MSPALANISTRATVGAGDEVLIAGFIIGDVADGTVILRALGPSLPFSKIGNRLPNPILSVHDANGSVIASNDDWKSDVNAPLIEKNGLAPPDDSEAAIVLHPPAGAYSAVVQGAGGEGGVALAEIFNLD